MGSRGNVYLTKRDSANEITDHIDLYWHNGGYDNEDYARAGLEASRSRWGDESYGTAQFLGALHESDNWPSGISIGSFDDNEYDLFEVCWSDRKVRKWSHAAHAEMDTLNDLSKAIQSWTFEEFLEKKPDEESEDDSD